jgi:hypothetical protein
MYNFFHARNKFFGEKFLFFVKNVLLLKFDGLYAFLWHMESF